MRKFKKAKVVWSMVCALICTLLPGQRLWAAEQYQVTYRSGNVGTFSIDGWKQLLTQKGYANEQVDVTENYIRIRVAKNASVPEFSQTEWSANTKITKADTYFVRNEKEWAISGNVDHNMECVVDYGKLVDPVNYEIEFVDMQSGAQVSAPVLGYGNAGDVIECTPVGVSNYATTDAPVSITLQAGKDNKVTFSYESTSAPETIVQTDVVTTTNVVTTQTTATDNTNTQAQTTNTPAQASQQQDAGQPAGTTTIDDDAVPLGNGTTDEDADQADAEDAKDAQEQEDETVEIEEDEVPLNDTVKEKKSVEIEDEATPLNDGVQQKTKGPVQMILLAMIACLLIAVAVLLVMIRQKKNANRE